LIKPGEIELWQLVIFFITCDGGEYADVFATFSKRDYIKEEKYLWNVY
jgi:hypothetical protein